MADAQTMTAAAPTMRTLIQELVNALTRAMRNITFYPPEHPMVAEMIAAAAHAVERVVAHGECLIKFINGEVVIDDRPLFDATSSVGSLVGACHNREIESIAFVPGVRANETGELIRLLAADPQEVREHGGASAVLGRRGVTHIAVDTLQTLTQGARREQSLSPMRETYAGALDVMRSAVRRARIGRPLNVEGTERAVDRLVDGILREQSAMLGLVSVKNYDEYTFTHALHICILCLGLGRAIGLGPERLRELGVSALLHDVGKVFVPLEILRKPDKLTPDEFKTIARHPIDGALILFGQERAPAVAPVVAFEHHLHCDGTGYPQIAERHAGARHAVPLHLYSLMVAIADVFDALTTERPYRPPLSPERALEMMHESEREQFEPRLLGRFTEMLGKYPAGTLVRLSSGALAIVARPNPADAVRPFVHVIIEDGLRRSLMPGEVDLGQRDPRSGAPRLEIVEVLDPALAGVEVSELLGALTPSPTPG
jgi:HD-GYP domain-containing protein (c-di-GMP phosphodiesterase class II)